MLKAILALRSKHLEHFHSLSPNTIVAQGKWNLRSLDSFIWGGYGLQGNSNLECSQDPGPNEGPRTSTLSPRNRSPRFGVGRKGSPRFVFRFLAWPRTTLGCSPPLDARQPLTQGIPQSISSWELPELRVTIPVGSAQGALDRGIPQLGNFSTEEFLGAGVSGHSRVVRIQGWFLAGLRFPRFLPIVPICVPCFAGFVPICSDLLRFLPISSDLFRFVFRFPRFLPICSDSRSLFAGIPRFVPVCSDLFRFVFRTNQGNPFLPTLFANLRRKGLPKQTPLKSTVHFPASILLGNDKRPKSRGFKKSAEIGHRSSAPLWLHRNTIKHVFWELSCPWREELPNADHFLNPRLSGLLSFPNLETKILVCKSARPLQSPKSGKPWKLHFQSPKKDPFWPPTWDPFKWPSSYMNSYAPGG